MNWEQQEGEAKGRVMGREGLVLRKEGNKKKERVQEKRKAKVKIASQLISLGPVSKNPLCLNEIDRLLRMKNAENSVSDLVEFNIFWWACV